MNNHTFPPFQRLQKIYKFCIPFFLILLLLNGCQSNVFSEWDCSASVGRACITVKEADMRALERIEKNGLREKDTTDALLKKRNR